MAKTYAGYGFAVNDLSSEALLSFMKKFVPEDYKRLKEKFLAKMPKATDEDIEEEMAFDVFDYINEIADHTPDYIRDVINEHEEKSGIPAITMALDNYLVFGAIDFVDSCPERAMAIKSKEDFKNLIGKYFDITEIRFGPIFECVYSSEDRWYSLYKE